MKEYGRESVRNIALVAPHGAGKTSLAEALLYLHGATEKLGKIDDGSSVLDYESEEKHRRMSINSHIAFFETKTHLVNLIDTPGFLNFLYEADCAIKVVDGAVIVVGAVGGDVSVQVRKYWDMTGNLPKIIFINKLEKENTSLEATLGSISKDLKVKLLPLILPIGQHHDFKGVIDVIEMKAYRYGGGAGFEEIPIPAEMEEAAGSQREKIIESVAELDDELLEKYLEGEAIDEGRIIRMLHEGILEAKIFPVLIGSATHMIGINVLSDAIAKYLPSPAERKTVEGLNPAGEKAERKPDPAEPLSAYIFKTVSDPYAGKISIFRVFSGTLNGDTSVYNSSKKIREKLGHLHRLIGKKEFPFTPAVSGDIVAVNKLKDASTGDTLTDEAHQMTIEPVELPPAVLSYAIEPKSRNDEDKLNPSLARIVEEDPTIHYRLDEETKEFLISGTGQSHVEVIVNKLRDTYGVHVELKKPRVPYKETVKGKAKAEGKYIKQTGGRGQYGDAWLEVEALPRGRGFEFVNNIVGGAIPKNFIPSVEKGVVEAMKRGVAAGYPVVDMKVTLYDGKYHTVDSSDIAFQIAGSMGFRKAMEDAKPVILEPVMKIEIMIPDECMGDVIGDVNSRRGKVSGVDPLNGTHVVKALIPMSEVLTYAPELRSITSGRGTFSMDFSHYDEVPDHLVSKIIDEAGAPKTAHEH
ncbi:MAG: translation elongation factor G [Candidatus Dadabacteria bacterium RIFCSPHIGHO2_12_FULL_53_21]|nr:MAG: translation elongation factor G [Candidatus Dadabacteria bacterium RIFCSPHIGHO2_12_FULL_53_21]